MYYFGIILERVFDIQSNVAKKIAKALKIKLSPEAKERLQKRPIKNLKAYNLYLQGRWFWNKRELGGYQKAIKYFEQALEEDSNYALAYAGIADSYYLMKSYGFGEVSTSKARAAALKALEIDDTLAEAHTSLAVINELDGDWEGAEREFKRAIELNPNYETAHHWYANYLMMEARFGESIKEIKRALELDPCSLPINRDVGTDFYYARLYDQAIDALQRTLEMDPNFMLTHLSLCYVYLEKSMHEEALEELQKEMELLKRKGTSLYSGIIGYIYARVGKRDEAQRILDELIKRSKQGSGLYDIARLYFALGGNDQGFRWLEKAYEAKKRPMRSLKVDPFFDRVCSDPRFKFLLKKMGLEK